MEEEFFSFHSQGSSFALDGLASVAPSGSFIAAMILGLSFQTEGSEMRKLQGAGENQRLHIFINMPKKKQSLPSPPPAPQPTIPRPNDVLFGVSHRCCAPVIAHYVSFPTFLIFNRRAPCSFPHYIQRGSGVNMYEGNIRFRVLIDGRRDAYIATTKHKEKKKIADELVDYLYSIGGRFLRLYEDGRTEEGSGIVEDGTWIEAERKVAVEKCKQSLRQKKSSKKKRPADADTEGKEEDSAEEEPDIAVSSTNVQDTFEELDPLPLDEAISFGNPFHLLADSADARSSTFLDESAHHSNSFPPSYYGTWRDV